MSGAVIHRIMLYRPRPGYEATLWPALSTLRASQHYLWGWKVGTRLRTFGPPEILSRCVSCGEGRRGGLESLFEVCVEGIAAKTGAGRLAKHFARAGKVREIEMPSAAAGGAGSRAWVSQIAYVRFSTNEEAREAVEGLSGSAIDGSAITVTYSEEGERGGRNRGDAHERRSLSGASDVGLGSWDQIPASGRRVNGGKGWRERGVSVGADVGKSVLKALAQASRPTEEKLLDNCGEGVPNLSWHASAQGVGHRKDDMLGDWESDKQKSSSHAEVHAHSSMRASWRKQEKGLKEWGKDTQTARQADEYHHFVVGGSGGREGHEELHDHTPSRGSNGGRDEVWGTVEEEVEAEGRGRTWIKKLKEKRWKSKYVIDSEMLGGRDIDDVRREFLENMLGGQGKVGEKIRTEKTQGEVESGV